MPYSSPATVSDGTTAPASWGNSVKAATDYLANPPACRVYHNAAQLAADATQLVLAFNSERYDTNGMHDTAVNNSRITINTAGLYLVTAQVDWAPGTYDYASVAIRLNGATFLAITDAPVTSGIFGNSRAVATVYKFIVGDYVETRVFQDNAASAGRNVQAQPNYSPEFSATWIGLG